MSIKTDGVVSGIATTALVKELSKAASRPKGLLETQISRLNKKQSAYTTLNTLLNTVKTSLTDIQKVSNFRSFAASVPSAASSYFSATATGSAIAGSYSVQITDTAKADMHILNQVSSSTATLNNSTLSIAFNTSSGFSDITVQINSTNDNNTLKKLASALDAKTGITSYVLNTGAASDPYRLVILSEKTGSDFTFSLSYSESTTSNKALLDSNGSSPSTTSTSNDHYRVTGKDATAKINGVTVSSATNVFSNAVTGLTITALADQDDAGVAAQNVGVTLDTTSISAKIQTFVNAYNGVVDFYSANNTINKTAGTKGVFVGDSNIRNIVNQLRTTVSKQYTSLTDSNGTVLNTTSDLNSLGVMGISFNSSTGKLAYTASKFVNALNSQQLDVEAMFSNRRVSSTSAPLSFSTTMEDLIKTYTTSGTGTLATLKTNTSTQIKALQTQVTRWNKRIAAFEARLFKQFTAMEKIAGNAQTASSFLGTFFAPKST